MRAILEKLDRSRRRMLAFGLGTPLAIVTIAILPKDVSNYADGGRFAMTAATFAIAGIGIAGFSVYRHRRRAAAMMWRYGSASSAVRDTLSYIRLEEHLARRGRRAALLASVASFGLYVTSFWPQMAALAPLHKVFGAVALAGLVAIPVLALRNRRHYVNRYFLFRYLRHQIDHIGYRPKGWRERRQVRRDLDAPPVVVTGLGEFRAGGFTWRLSDFYANAIVFGQTGAGKTIALLNTLLEGLIASSTDPKNRIGGLILDAKGDFRDKIEALCARYGRLDDLLILDPDTWATDAGTWRSIAWNPLDSEDDDELELSVRLIAALRLIGLDQGKDGGFWLDSAKVFIRHTLALIRAGRLTEAPSLIDIYRLAQEGDETTPFYHELIRAIARRFPGDVPQEVKDAIAFFEGEWAHMAAPQKSGVIGSITQLLDEFQIAPFRDMFTRASTYPIGNAIDDGKIIYAHLPAAKRERMSRVANTLLKLEYQRRILQRPDKSRPSFMLIDEAQTAYVSGEGRGDSDFFERSRQSRHANIAASQNLPAFLKRVRNEHDVRNFLGNCAVKIMLRNGDVDTNRWASALFGQRSEIVITTNEQAAIDGGWARRHTSYGRATRNVPVVPESAFAELPIPVKGDPAQRHAGSIVLLGSRGEVEHHVLDWPVNPLR